MRCETLSAAEVEARWPLRLDDGETAVYQADGGITRADRAHTALLAEAVEGGVEVRDRTAVLGLELGPGEVQLTLETGELRTRAVVVAAGSWASELLSSVGVSLPVVPTRETVVYLDLPHAARLPPVIDYGRLPSPGEGGISRVRTGGLCARRAGYGVEGRAPPLRARDHPGRRPRA